MRRIYHPLQCSERHSHPDVARRKLSLCLPRSQQVTYRYFEHKLLASIVGHESIENGGQLFPIEFHYPQFQRSGLVLHILARGAIGSYRQQLHR